MLETLDHIDRAVTLWLNGSDSLFLDGVAMTATTTSTWIPAAVILLYVIIHNNEMKHIGLMVAGIALCVLIADQGASSVCKPFFARLRPTHNPEIAMLVDVVHGYRGGLYGFISSHAANTVSVALFVSLIIKRREVSWALASWALLNCWTRVYLGVHYVGDLLCGALWGALVGWGIYKLYLRLSGDTANRSLRSYSDSAYHTVDVQLLCAAIYASYIYVCFCGLVFT